MNGSPVDTGDTGIVFLAAAKILPEPETQRRHYRCAD
jgi:hypothetical protein